MPPFFRPRHALLAVVLFFGTVHCLPEYEFGGEFPEHCANGELDADLDEVGVDCGGPCRDCGPMCAEGRAECDGDLDEECETNVLTDATHCGECGSRCELVGAEASCLGGACQIASCVEPFDNCDAIDSNGCEENLSTSAEHCGRCGVRCSDIHGTPSCDQSECQIECDAGWGDCNDNRDNGCERPVTEDVLNCGGCGRACDPPPGETPYCVDGMCGSTACPEGFGDCNGMPDDECERDLLTDPQHCGHCGGPCLVQNGVGACVDGVCVVDACEDGYGNCNTGDDDAGYGDGCETNLNTDVDHCGGCGDVCEIVNADAICRDGECRVGNCSGTFADCNGDEVSCETDTSGDKTNCGGCAGAGGLLCDEIFEHATGLCADSACEMDDCLPGYGDCTAQNGCETTLASSDQHCGICNVECRDVGGTNTCSNNQCQPVCDANHLNCDGVRPNGCEVDRRTDEQHCGTCENECLVPAGTTGNTCTAGECRPACDANHLNCDGDGADGCETDRRTDEQNCGACETVCLTPVGTSANTCQNSECVPTCTGTRASCDDDGANGCETNLASNNSHCGVCDRACLSGGATHATANNCNAAGVCVPTCEAGWGACGTPEAGCTTQLNTPARCGACNVSCSGETSFCVDLKCQARIAVVNDVDGVANGPALNLTHALQAGPSRLLLLAVAGRAIGTGGLGQAKPEVVTYGGTNMTFFGELDGGPPLTDGQAHLFYYYLLESQLAALGNGNKTIVIDGSASAQPANLLANATLFTGVRQTTPIAASASQVFNLRCENANPPGQPGNSITLGTAGSVIYSMSSAQYAGTGSPGSSITTTMDQQTAGGTMRAMGGTLGLASLLPAGPRTVGWSYAFCSNSVHYAIAIHPAQAP